MSLTSLGRDINYRYADVSLELIGKVRPKYKNLGVVRGIESQRTG